MESRLLKAWGSILARGWLRAIIIITVVFGAVVCLALVSLLLPVSEEARLFIWAGGMLGFLALAIGGILAWGLQQRSRRGGQFDEIFGPFGLQGRGYLTIGRQYHGSYNGRQVDIYFNRGPQLDLYVSAVTHTRMGIGRKDALANAIRSVANMRSLSLADPELANFNVSAHDERWGRELLAQADVKAAVLRLFNSGDASGHDLRSLVVQPDGIHLTQRYISTASITPENARDWLSDLFSLARTAESLPRVSQPVEATRLEQRNRTNRDAFLLPVFLWVFGFLGVMLACVGGAAALILWLESGR